MSFQLSPCVIDKNIFLVRRSRLEGRLDPNTYHPNRLFAINRVKRCGFKTEKLGRFASFKKIIVTSISETDTYVGLENIESNTGCYFATKNKTNISSALVFKKGQVLFPKLRPYLNKVFYANFDGICSTEFHVLDNHVVSNKYLAYFLGLDVVVTQTTLLMSGNTLPRLQTEDIKKILIPIPPLEIQNKIITKMDAAYFTKKQKEIEAQRLLDSINNYLLGELGIELQETKENTIQRRIFKRKYNKVSGRRFDPLYYSGNIYQTIDDALYETVNITNVTHYLKSGFAAGKQDQSNGIDDIIQIRPTNINSNREFDFSRNVYINKTNLIKRKNDILKYGEVLFNNTNSQELVGKTILFDLDGTYFCSNHITRILPNNEVINGQYLTSLLNLYQKKQVFFKICTNWNNQSGVNVDVLGKIKIPLPPLKKQEEIAKQITSIRIQAKQLQQEAITELEQAKKEVEVMIMGDLQ